MPYLVGVLMTQATSGVVEVHDWAISKPQLPEFLVCEPPANMAFECSTVKLTEK